MFFQINMKKIVAALLIILFPIILFNLEPSLKLIGKPFLEISYRIQGSLGLITQGVGDTTSKYLNLISIKKTNKNLLKEVSELKIKNVAYKELKLENERLKKMLELKDRSPMVLKAATVIANDIITENLSVTVNIGQKQGVSDGMGVLGLNGVIGTILKTSVDKSQILILTDRFFVTEGVIQRSREKVIVEGAGDNYLIAKHIGANADIQIGDLIVTAGTEASFPKGLPIGVVEKVRSSNAGLTKLARIKPLTDLYNVEELFVILDRGEEVSEQ